MAAPVVETVSTATDTTTSLSITKPTGTVEGDFLYCAVSVSATTTVSMSGWTQDFTVNFANDQGVLVGFYKTAGASEPSSYSISIGTNTQVSAGMLRISGSDGADPIDNTLQGSFGTSFNAPSVTTTVDDSLVLRIGGSDDATGGAHVDSFPTSTTIQVDQRQAGDDANVHISSFTQATAGAKGTGTFGASANLYPAGATIAIAPAAASEFTATAALTIGGVEFSGSATFSPLTPPNAPSGLTATVDGSTINLTWTDNSSNESGFKIYRRRTP